MEDTNWIWDFVIAFLVIYVFYLKVQFEAGRVDALSNCMLQHNEAMLILNQKLVAQGEAMKALVRAMEIFNETPDRAEREESTENMRYKFDARFPQGE